MSRLDALLLQRMLHKQRLRAVRLEAAFGDANTHCSRERFAALQSMLAVVLPWFRRALHNWLLLELSVLRLGRFAK